MKNRKGENSINKFRSNRIVYLDNNWYVKTREGILGPYANKEQAEERVKEKQTQCNNQPIIKDTDYIPANDLEKWKHIKR